MNALPLMKGTLDLLVLKALSWTPKHGLEITTWLDDFEAGKTAALARGGGVMGRPTQ